MPPAIVINGALGRAIAGAAGITLEFWDGRKETWPNPATSESSMDRAMAEIVAWLDGNGEFSDSAENSLQTLETIVACHVSHRRNAAWTILPLSGEDRELEVQSG